jgi:hypothetical protein
MKTVLLIILAAVSLATSACTSTRNSSYQYSSSYSQGYNSCEPSYPIQSYVALSYRPRPSYNSCEQEHVRGPMYYRSNVPYYRGNIRNYTGVPIVAPDARNPRTSVIIPNSWN